MRYFLLAALLSFVIPSSVRAQEVLFFDDFEGGLDDAWVMPDGGWDVVAGRLQMTSGGYLYAGGEHQSDYLVSFEFQIDGQPYLGAAGCFISISSIPFPETNGYFIGYECTHDGFEPVSRISIVRIDDGAWNRLVYVESDFPSGVQYVRLGRFGSELVLKIWADGDIEPDWQLMVVDELYHSGYWMPSITGFSGWIDNFLVEGYGPVSTEHSSWGAVKALYR